MTYSSLDLGWVGTYHVMHVIRCTNSWAKILNEIYYYCDVELGLCWWMTLEILISILHFKIIHVLVLCIRSCFPWWKQNEEYMNWKWKCGFWARLKNLLILRLVACVFIELISIACAFILLSCLSIINCFKVGLEMVPDPNNNISMTWSK